MSGFPEELVKVVNYLNEKDRSGEFKFRDSISYWEDNEQIIIPLEMGHEGGGYYFAVALSFVATQKDGNLVFSNKDNVWRWAWALHLIAGVADWEPDFMMRVIQSFEGKRENIEGLMNWATQIYGNAYYDDAVELMTLMPQYRVSIFAGLMENDFDRYCSKYPPFDNAEEFAQAVVKANNLKEEEVNKAFDMALMFSSFSSTAAMAFFLSIRGRVDDYRKQKCEERILGLLKGDTTPYLTPMCKWMFMEHEMSAFEEECLLTLIKGLYGEKKESSLKAIDHSIGIHLKDPEKLTKLFVCIAENLMPTDILSMEGCLRELHKHKDYFQNLVLSFVMHPKGMFRIVGRRLWDGFHMEASDFDAQKDLPEELQCLFIISMLQDYGNPETRLPKLLPLLDSKSEKVQRILMGQLGPYLDDYMGHVITALNKLKLDGKFIKMIKQYYERRAVALEKRRSMKELSPRYSYGRELQETLRLQKVHLQEKMKEAEKQHKSIMKDLMKKVVLARGGGWRDENGKVHPLAHFKYSMPSRQLEQAMSPMEQDIWLNELLKDWNGTSGNS